MNATNLRLPLIKPLLTRMAARPIWNPRAALLISLLWWGTVSGATETNDLAADQVSVRELMRLETQQALQRLRDSTAGGSRQGRGLVVSGTADIATVTASTARLVAIYGVGKKLMAEVRVDGRTLLFMRGRPKAIGPGGNHAMRLLSIGDSCVEVSLSGRQKSLCAPMSGDQEG